MSDFKYNLQVLATYYETGPYTKDEILGSILEIFKQSSDFLSLWDIVPDWARSSIWNFLKQCDETTVLYNFSSQKRKIIDPNLIALKSWLSVNKGYA